MTADDRATALSPLLPVRLGLTRGLIAFRSLITSREGLTQNLVWNLIPLGLLLLNRTACCPAWTSERRCCPGSSRSGSPSP
jgi:hypothetical protein